MLLLKVVGLLVPAGVEAESVRGLLHAGPRHHLQQENGAAIRHGRCGVAKVWRVSPGRARGFPPAAGGEPSQSQYLPLDPAAISPAGEAASRAGQIAADAVGKPRGDWPGQVSMSGVCPVQFG